MKNLIYQKGIAPIIAVILLAIVFVGGGIYYFGRCQFPTQCLASTTVAKDATANWKTYAKDEYGFKIKYDPSWLKGDVDGPDYVREQILSWDFFNNDKLFKQLKQTSGQKNCLPSLSFTIYKPERKLDEPYREKFVETKDIQGVSVRVYESADNNNNCGYRYAGIIKLKNGNIFAVELGQITDKKAIISIFNQIISTFKFTDQNQAVDTSTWKTYTNTDYNFSLKYPQQFTLEVKSYPGKGANYENDRRFGYYYLWFNSTEEGVEKFSGYSIDLLTSSNKTLAEQFSDRSLVPLSDNHGADEAAVYNFKSNEPSSINENFTRYYFRVKDTVFVTLPALQDVTATDRIWNYPVMETLRFTKSNVTDEMSNPYSIGASWKMYTNTDAKISINYPPEWTVTEETPNAEYKGILLEGKEEGQVGIRWGAGFGGGCPQGYETLKLYSTTAQSCRNINDDGTENWSFSKANAEVNGINYSGYATANSPYASNRRVILQILSTLKFTK